MEFNEKLHNLRVQRGLTQDELARVLFVSRTAISKWESGRGYPSIDSLRQIAKYFEVSLDLLLSPSEALSIAEENGKEKESRFRNLIFGLLDLSSSMLLFLPLFAQRLDGENETIRSASLLSLIGISPYLRFLFIAAISLSVTLGILTLALAEFNLPFWHRHKAIISLILNTGAALLFILSLHPYAAAFSFSLLVIKAVTLIKKA